MRTDIDAIAFDIDGTLYPNLGFYRYLGAFLLSNARFLQSFGKVRKEIRLWQEAHPLERHADFFFWQAELLSRYMHCTPGEALRAVDDKIYNGWKPLFAKVHPYPFLFESFTAFRKAGLKIGLLSDFRPEQKGDVWGLAPLCDAIIGSEETGALKPSPVPFLALSDALSVPSSRILYVGNSIRSDVRGAASAGMKTACIINPFLHALGCKVREADISFSDYRQLTCNVLK